MVRLIGGEAVASWQNQHDLTPIHPPIGTRTPCSVAVAIHLGRSDMAHEEKRS